MRTPALPKAERIADSGDVNRNLLIDQLVRETMVLIAHLATQGGARAPLSDVAERVFRGLVDELSAQRLSHKVIADMFGLALRTYYDRVRRASESRTMRGRSLWEALHEHVAAKGSATRGQILERFRNDDEAIVKAVLADLVASGLLARAGKGARATYMIVPSPDTADADTLTALVQVALFHRGHADATAIAATLAVGEDVARAALEALVADGRAARTVSGYEAASILIPANDPAGFEAAVLDHVQAMIGALCHRLQRRPGQADPFEAAIGGSTYTFDIAPDNPTWGRVTSLLADTRARLSALRAEADAFEAARPAAGGTSHRFVFYCGENALGPRPPRERSS